MSVLSALRKLLSLVKGGSVQPNTDWQVTHTRKRLLSILCSSLVRVIGLGMFVLLLGEAQTQAMQMTGMAETTRTLESEGTEEIPLSYREIHRCSVLLVVSTHICAHTHTLMHTQQHTHLRTNTFAQTHTHTHRLNAKVNQSVISSHRQP